MTKLDNKTHLAGALVPQSVMDFLNLYCYVHHRTKSDLIRNLIVRWVTEKKEIYSPELLIKHIVENLQESWEYEKIKYPGSRKAFQEFKFNTEKELMKSLDKETIAEILNSLNE